MPRFALLLVLALSIPALGASAPRAPARAPLQRLALIIHASLPGLGTPRYQPLRLEDGTVPAALNPEKAMALAALAQVEAGDVERPRSPFALLKAINAALLDIDPGSLSAEQAQGVAGLILDRRASIDAVDLEAARALGQAHEARQLGLRGKLERSVDRPVPEPYIPTLTEIRGVPAHVARVPGRRVWRHYTSRAGMEAIVAGRRLFNGVVPYARPVTEAAKRSLLQPWEVYRDLTGIFLTLPSVSPQRVELGSKAKEAYYVDVRLPAGVPVLELEPEAIYLAPFPRRTPRSPSREYYRWAAGGKIDVFKLRGVRELDEAGGPGPELLVPVEVVGRGKTKN